MQFMNFSTVLYSIGYFLCLQRPLKVIGIDVKVVQYQDRSCDKYNNKKVYIIVREKMKAEQGREQEKLDDAFVKMLMKIEEKYGQFGRHVQIRIERWVGKLLECDENSLWKKYRNNYLKLLYQMTEVGWVGLMFDRMPPEEPLPNFPDQHYKTALHQVLKHKTKTSLKKVPTQHTISIKQVTEAGGDDGEEVPPSCPTSSRHSTQGNTQSYTPVEEILSKINGLMRRHEAILSGDEKYHQLRRQMQEILSSEESLMSTELRVEEGIQKSRINFLHFRSPREENEPFLNGIHI